MAYQIPDGVVLGQEVPLGSQASEHRSPSGLAIVDVWCNCPAGKQGFGVPDDQEYPRFYSCSNCGGLLATG